MPDTRPGLVLIALLNTCLDNLGQPSPVHISSPHVPCICIRTLLAHKPSCPAAIWACQKLWQLGQLPHLPADVMCKVLICDVEAIQS